MIEGVRLLPWVAAQERLTPGARPYDCTSCQRQYSADERAALRCGWVRGGAVRSDPEGDAEQVFGDWKQHQVWRGVRGAAIGGRLGPVTCPGYTCRLPEVQDVARFWGWEQRGVAELNVRARGLKLSAAFLDLADVFASEAAGAQRWEHEQVVERARKERPRG